MAIKPNKSNFTLSANLSKLEKPASITIAGLNLGDDSSSSLSSEGQATSENANAASRYEILYKSGISPLKALLIANTEFVPIGVGTIEEGVSTINLNFGEEGSITVTNCARLIELHRQIRGYILQTSKHLFKKSNDFDVDKFISGLQYALKVNTTKKQTSTTKKSVTGGLVQKQNISPIPKASVPIESCIDGNDPTISKTVKTIIQKLSELPATNSLFDTNTNKKFNSKAIKKYTTERTTMSSLRAVARAHKDNPLLKSIVEYVLYESIIFDSIEYLSGMLRLKQDLDKNYSITEMEMSGEDFNGLDIQFGSKAQIDIEDLDAGESSGLSAYDYDQEEQKSHTVISGESLRKKNLGINFSSGTADVHKLSS